MRLIDADELMEKSWDVDCRIGYVQVVDVGDILEAHTIDAVEVVRCKDCIHAKEMTQYGCGECVRHCEKLKIVTSPNWFCAEGRRKDEGGTD